MRKYFRNILIKKNAFACSRLPSLNFATKKVECDAKGVLENFVLPRILFQIFSEKVLTNETTNVLLNIFPLTGSGSLKFTLCD